MKAKPSVKDYLNDLEDLWQKIDLIFNSLSSSDWNKKHGRDWIMSDVPYHISYFDRDLVVESLKKGERIPKIKQKVFKSIKELNNWNAKMFKKRPKNQTIEDSLKQMRQSRAEVRKQLAKMKDVDLANKVFAFLPGMGWIEARELIEGLIGHTWSHLMQLRIHLKKDDPKPLPSSTNKALGMYMGVFPIFLNKKEAEKTDQFIATMDFIGPGGGAWSFKVNNGSCEVVEAKERGADLVMTQTAETFVKTFNKIQNPLLAILTGKIKIKGFKKYS